MNQMGFYFFRQNATWALRMLKRLIVVGCIGITALIEVWHFARH